MTPDERPDEATRAPRAAPDPASAKPLKTVSLRRRVMLSTIAVLAVALTVGAVLVQTLFAVQSSRDVRTRLAERYAAAQQMDRNKVAPAELVRRSSGRGILASEVTTEGSVYGPPDLRQQVGPDNVVRNYRLPSGARLTLATTGAELSNAQDRLFGVLIAVSLATLCATGLVLLVTVRFALRPLDTMTALARSISEGRRGGRLRPESTDTELGRTSAAFDEMLDALEGAEQAAQTAESQARASEGRTKQFLADAAHELRTPLAGVQAAAEAVLQAGPAADADTRDRMNLLLIREARRASRLVEDLLSLARIDAGLELNTARLDLYDLVGAEVERTHLLAPSLRCDLRGAPAVVPADPDRLGQVLTNVLDNARRYTPANGEIRITVDAGQGPVVAGSGAPTGMATVTVADSGPGVPAADRERIFQRMVRLDEARSRNSGGSGLGLAIARGIARAHGGDLLCVEPPPETSGAVFRLLLPLAGPDAPESGAAADTTSAEHEHPAAPSDLPPGTDSPTRPIAVGRTDDTAAGTAAGTADAPTNRHPETAPDETADSAAVGQAENAADHAVPGSTDGTAR